MESVCVNETVDMAQRPLSLQVAANLAARQTVAVDVSRVTLLQQFGVFREAETGEVWSRRAAMLAAENGLADVYNAELL